MSTPTLDVTAVSIAVRRSPFQGLVPYSAADADWFFGRNEWCEVVADNLRAYRISVLYGTSGAGKSSVLRAGSLARLTDQARANVGDLGVPRLLPVIFSAWSLDHPLGELKDAVAAAAAGVAPELAGDPPEGSLADVLEAWAKRIEGPVMLVLDQFEELFLYHDHPGDTALDELAAALRRPNPAVHFLLSIREDSLAKLDRFKGHVSGLLDHLLRIDHLARDAAAEAIVMPLKRWSERPESDGQEVTAEPVLVEAVLDQVTAGQVSLADTGTGQAAPRHGGPEGIVAPYLQLVLERLWTEEHRRWDAQLAGEPRVLRKQALDDLGGAEKIVSMHLDAALAALPERDQDVAGRVFRQLVTPSGTKIALRVADLAQLADLPEDRIEPLVGQLTGDVRILRGAGEGRYEIYHDALSGPILDWSARWHERQVRRRERKKIAILGGIAIFVIAIAVVIAAFAIQANHAKQSAEEKARLASVALAGQATATLPSDLVKGLQLAIQAGETSETTRAREALRAALVAPWTLLGHTDRIYSATFSPDGKLVVTTSADGTARFWDLPETRGVRTVKPPRSVVAMAAFSPDGKRVVTASSNGMAMIWDVASGRSLHTITHPAYVQDAKFSPNGKLIVTACADGTARIWDAASGRGLHTLRGHTDVIRITAFSPDGKRVVTGADDGTVRIWDVATGRGLHILKGHGKYVYGVVFSPDSTLVSTLGAEGTAWIWDVASGRKVHTLSALATAPAFSPNGKLVIEGEYPDEARIRDVAGGRVVRALTGHTNYVRDAKFSPDGKLVVTAGADSTARIWDPATGRSLRTFDHPDGVQSAVFSPDGKLVLTIGDDGKARVWTNADAPDLPFEQLLARARERLAAAGG